MRSSLSAVTLLLFFFLPSEFFGQASCSSPQALTTNNCFTGDLQNAVSEAPAGTCGGATASTTRGVWFRFTATKSSTTISLSGFGSNLTAATTYVELFSGACGSLVSTACSSAASPLTVSGLSVNTSYYIRVYVTATTTGNPGNRRGFTICVQDPPANDLCQTATTLTSNATCTNTAGTLSGATASVPAVSSTCGTPGADVWYSFVAKVAYPVITISGIETTLRSNTTYLQLLSGTCGTMSGLGCASSTNASFSFNSNTVNGGAGLTVGATYYIRIYTTAAAPTGTGWNFSMCVTEPTPAQVQFSRTYINVTKGATGGTIDPGDILEMRAIFVIPETGNTGKTIDSLSFMDTIYSNSGLSLVPNSIALRTNEGKVYGNGGLPFTDALDGDVALSYASGTNTVVKLNFGTGSSSSRRGSLTNTSRPSVFGTTCIIMATYRVQVTGGYNTRINYRTGALTFRDAGTGVYTHATFGKSELVVYSSPGLCPNAVSATNALGVETNGTFGAPANTTPLVKDRGPSPFTNYTYAPFTLSSPGDYYYGITNNTSGSFTTVTTWPKPEATNTYRVFSQWDIAGDHTGASDPTAGNAPCDINKPVSATNPCGYMLVVNSSYKPDTAFQYTMNNLCPNTYYEISVWLKNICYKCGGDSLGRTASNASYIPYAPNDSSGVQPNLAFDVNGVDYYTTGDIRYYGTTQTGSDATNKWVKRGFTYLTGASETSFTLTIRNNAPGGGGNDWALDDIAVATCLPNMTYSPTVTPFTCKNNPITIHDTVRTYFDNYKYYKWQRSNNNGATWTDITGQAGTANPVWNGKEWEYVLPYTIQPEFATISNNGDKYRVAVSTTAGNLSNSNCLFSDGISIVTLTVDDCTVLPVKLMSFNGKAKDKYAILNWAATNQTEAVKYVVERSTNGINYSEAGTIHSGFAGNTGVNKYTYTDSIELSNKTWYRLKIVDVQNNSQFSNSIALESSDADFLVTGLVNPFSNNLSFNITAKKAAPAELTIANLMGVTMKKKSITVNKGTNAFSFYDLHLLPPGIYVMEIKYDGYKYTSKVIKDR